VGSKNNIPLVDIEISKYRKKMIGIASTFLYVSPTCSISVAGLFVPVFLMLDSISWSDLLSFKRT